MSLFQMNEETGEEYEKKLKAQSNFLFAFNHLARKHDIDFLNDVDINFENMTINVKTEMEDRRLLIFRKLLIFIAELEKLIGQLE